MLFLFACNVNMRSSKNGINDTELVFKKNIHAIELNETLVIEKMNENNGFQTQEITELNNIIENIKTKTIIKAVIEINKNLDIEFKAEEIDQINKSNPNLFVKGVKLFYYWMSNPLLKKPNRNILKLNYTLICNDKSFRFNFYSRGDIRFFPVPLDFFKIALLSIFFNKAGLSNLEVLSAILTLNFLLIELLTEGMFRDAKLGTSPFKQFKLEFKENLEKVGQDCNGSYSK
jgi:hypothetical protein